MKYTYRIKQNYEFRRLYRRGQSAATPFLLREAYRLHEHEIMKSYDFVIVARSRMVGTDCSRTERELMRAMKRLGLVENGGEKA